MPQPYSWIEPKPNAEMPHAHNSTDYLLDQASANSGSWDCSVCVACSLVSLQSNLFVYQNIRLLLRCYIVTTTLNSNSFHLATTEKYGEEKHAGKIARTITHYRKTCGPILTTKQLADVIETSFDKRSKRTDACGRRWAIYLMIIAMFLNQGPPTQNGWMGTITTW